jgi:hypothetical protein
MLTIPAYKSTLTDVFCQWLQYDFSNAALDPKIDSLSNAIRADVYADTKKFYTNADFDANLTSDVTVGGGPGGGTIIGIKSFITNRRNALIAELFNNNCYVGIAETTAPHSLNIFPNPAAARITVNFDNISGHNTVSVTNALGQLTLRKENVTNGAVIDISFLAPGVYTVTLNESDHVKLLKTR